MCFPVSAWFRLIVALTLVVAGAVRSGSADEPESARETESSASSYGSLAWISADELDLIGELGADLPWTLSPATELYFGLWTQTAITESLDDLTFEVR